MKGREKWVARFFLFWVAFGVASGDQKESTLRRVVEAPGRSKN